jgi:hypothetical protein
MCGFEVEFFDAVATQHDHPGFLRMGGVDEHFVGHCKSREKKRTARSTPLWRKGRVICAFVGEENG